MKTVESVTRGHPDKVCDQIADAILDEYLRKDTEARVAVEILGTDGMLVVGGEVTSKSEVDCELVAKQVYGKIGYKDDLEVFVNINHQSPDIARGLSSGGAGDSSVVYGYATTETDKCLPKPVVLANEITKRLDDIRMHDPVFSWLGPDGKVQVGMDGAKVRHLVLAVQHADDMEASIIERQICDQVIEPVIGDVQGANIMINPTGRFVVGGFTADTGLTNRKLAADTHGGLIPHGGGGFSGKDATKPDRSAAYMARFVAKNIVANGLAKGCLVSAAYAIGIAKPVALQVKTSEGKDLTRIAEEKFDWQIPAIIERLDLRKPIYSPVSCYGHFGREGMPWEDVIEI